MDGIVLSTLLSLTGVVLALAGLGVLVRRVDARVAAVAAVAGGVIVAGLAWLRPPSPTVEEPMAITAAPIVLSADRRRTELAPTPSGPPPPLPGREAASIRIEASEAETNDTLPSANVAAPGVGIDGTLSPGDRDWFAVDVPEGMRGRLVATLVTEDASVSMTLFDDAGQTLGIAQTLEQVRVRTATLDRNLDGPRYYLLLMPGSDAPARYQLTLAVRR